MSDAITRLNAALEGRYTIERELGEGGMATVYLADDLKHERKVALKVLKPELAALVGAERFLAEIKTTANLQHPHILALFDSGEADGVVFYVMPYIEGESLRDRLDREKQMGVKDAVAISQKVADALDYAHERGVVHRDIKPGNILLSERGEPLVADFGIALAVAQAGAGRITETGLSLGTPHYMSPEQATGDRDVDPRSDVFALACVLYEMLSGESPFSAPTAQAVLVRILTTEAPSITAVRRTVDPNVAAALAQALEKLPADRFTSAAEFAAALGDEAFSYQARPPTTATTPRPETVAAPVPVAAARPWHQDRRVLAAALVATGAVAAWGWLRPPPAPPPTLPDHATRLPIDLGEIALNSFDKIVVSPDGSRFAVTRRGARALYWRGAAEESFRLIPGTEGAREAAFSPDGNWIVYAMNDGLGLFKVSLLGGAPTPVVPPGDVQPAEPHWGDDETIVFTGPDGMYRVPDTGGEPVLLVDVDEAFRNPSLLPGGGAVIGARGGRIMLLDLETEQVRELIPAGRDPQYVETGHLLYADGAGGLWAVPFDARRGEVLGGAVPVFDGLTVLGPSARYSVSRNGTLVYGTGGAAGAGTGGGRRLLVVDLEGNEEPLVLAPRDLAEVKWSPDGQSVAYSSVAEGDDDLDIYTYSVELGTTPRPLTFEGVNVEAVFSPDGSRVAFASEQEGTDGLDLFVKSLDDDVPARSVITLPGDQIPTQWPTDELILFEQGPPPSDLWMLHISDGDSVTAEVYLPSEAHLREVVISPNGSLAAYTSDETGRPEVYIRSFPSPGERAPVSDGGGEFPVWSPDGNTVYYWGLAGAGGENIVGGDAFMAAEIQLDPTPVVLSRESLFRGDYFRPGWDLHPDGERMIVPQNLNEAADLETVDSERFLVVVNWFEELLERVGN